jgi:hypothetical protein
MIPILQMRKLRISSSDLIAASHLVSREVQDSNHIF